MFKNCMNGLKYSDVGVVKNKMRQEIRQVADEDYIYDIDYYFEKGKTFLQRSKIL